MQAAGRAGRDAANAAASEMWIQTWNPRHGLYAALRAHDYQSFAAGQLAERRAAGLPPFASLALVRAESRNAEVATAFVYLASPESSYVTGEVLAVTGGLPVMA